MKVVVFGASGGTGTWLVRDAVAAGHSVTAFVRDAQTYRAPGSVRAVTGDARDVAAVNAAVDGQDAVLSALGSRTLAQDDLLEVSGANIVAAMKANDVERIVVLGAAGAVRPAMGGSSLGIQLVSRAVTKTLLRYPMASQKMLQLMIARSGLDYTIVNPPRLLDVPGTGQYRVLEERMPRNGRQIARADVAAFMVAQLTSSAYSCKTVHIAW